MHWVTEPHESAPSPSLADEPVSEPTRRKHDTGKEIVLDLRDGQTGGLIHLSIVVKAAGD